MKKWERVLADGQWHHFSDIASIRGAGLAHLDGRVERKEEKVVKQREDGRKVVITIVMYRLKTSGTNPDKGV